MFFEKRHRQKLIIKQKGGGHQFMVYEAVGNFFHTIIKHLVWRAFIIQIFANLK